MSFRFEALDIPDVVLIRPDTYEDSRGYFREVWKESAFEEGGLRYLFAQANCSRSSRGVLRGLHFQREPASVDKLITIASGAVLDVAVDVRPGSPSFGGWVSAELSAENGHALLVPQGFAHGFQALEDNTVAFYLMSGEFSPEHDAGVRWDSVGINWSLPDPILSEKDQRLPALENVLSAKTSLVGASEPRGG